MKHLLIEIAFDVEGEAPPNIDPVGVAEAVLSNNNLVGVTPDGKAFLADGRADPNCYLIMDWYSSEWKKGASR